MLQLFRELKRRNVIRVAIAYLAGAWLIIQIVETLFPVYGLTATHIRIVVTALGIGFIPALILSWKFEWTPSGLVADADIASSRDGRATRTLDRAITVTLLLAVTYFAVDKFVIGPPPSTKA